MLQTQNLSELEEKELFDIEIKLDNLLKNGSNDESLISRKKELLLKKYSPKL